MHRWSAVALVLALSGGGLTGGPCARAVAAQSSPPSDSGKTVSRAVQAALVRGTVEAQLRDYKEAISYFEEALDRAPSAPALLQALADAHAAQGDLSTALFYARKARSHGPDRAYYARRLAELQRRAGNLQAAQQTYQALLKKFPDERAAYHGLAELQVERDRPEEALDTYKKLLARRPRSPVSVYRKMLPLYRRTGNRAAVGETLQALVGHRPNNRRYRRLLGKHYAEEGRPEAALDLLAPLAQQTPDDTALQRLVQQLSQKIGQSPAASAPAGAADTTRLSSLSLSQLVDRARTALERARTSADTTSLQTAERLLRRALDKSPRHVPARRLQARLYEQRGAHHRAGRLLKRTVEDNPKVPALWRDAAKAFLRARKYESAASVAEEGLLLFPGASDLAQTAAVARLRGRSPAQALKHFQRALDLLPNDSVQTTTAAELYAGKALAYTYLGRPQEADTALAAALSKAPDHPPVLRDCAYSLALRSEQLDRALTLAQQAVERSSKAPRALHVLGWVHFQRDRPKAARRSLRRALEAGSPTATLLEHFGDVQHALNNDAAARRYWNKALDRAPDRSSIRKKLEKTSAP